MAVPKIRIKGYTDEWKNQFVKSICDISTGKSNTQDKIIDGKYPFFVRSSNIERSNKYLYDEEAVLTAGDGVGTGKVFHYVNGKYDLHQRVYRMFNFRDIDSKFFFHIFSSKFYERVMSMTAKSSVDSVRYDMISDMEITVPNVITEQEAISNYFQSLDSLIEATDKKIATLKQTKQASLQSMFPQEGETKPRVRFKGFADEWEKTELSEITTIKKGEQINKSELTNDGKYYVLNGGMLPSGNTNEYNTLENTISISEGGNSCGFVFFNEQKFWSGGHNYTLQNVKIHSYFLFAYLKGIEDFIMSKRVGSGLPNIQKSALAEIPVFYPTNIIEQEKIAEYFSNLDKQISLQEQRLEKLKQIKSACLKNMFV